MTEPVVKAEGVRKSFGRLEVLKGISLEVDQGQVFVLLGPSGSGKSTFLRCINHLEKINAGRIWVDGELIGYREVGDKLHELRDSEIVAARAKIGMVFQHFNLFPHMTAIENVVLAQRIVLGRSADEARRRGNRAARPGRARRQGRRVPVPALRRPAAAGRDRARAGDGPEADALRRGHQRPRPRARQGRARRDAGAGAARG